MINIRPSNKIFETLRYSPCDSAYAALSELIDNSYSAADNKEVKVEITFRRMFKHSAKKKNLRESLNLKESYVIVKDNSSGIKDLSTAFVLSGTGSKNSLNEHGMGLKVALVSMGCGDVSQGIKNFKIVTKTFSEKLAKEIYKIEVECIFDKTLSEEESNATFPEGSGTEIKVNELSNIFVLSKYQLKVLFANLGARYQKLIEGSTLEGKSGKKLTIEFTIISDYETDTPRKIEKIKIEPVTASYRNNKPFINAQEIRGKKWTALLYFGYCPSEEEDDDDDKDDKDDDKEDLSIPLSFSNKKHPYYWKNRKVTIFSNNRLISTVNYSDIGIDKQNQSVARTLRGKGDPRCEIFLLQGFRTIFTKDDIYKDNNFDELCDEVRGKINPFLRKEYADLTQEKEMKNMHEEYLKSCDLDYSREYTIGCLGIKPDFVQFHLDEYKIVEYKAERGEIADVLQVLNYIIFSTDKFRGDKEISKKSGVLYCKGLSDSARNLISYLKTFKVNLDGIDIICKEPPSLSTKTKKS